MKPPATYCNPLPLPNFQRGRVSATSRKGANPGWGWTNPTARVDFREMADPTVIRFDDRWYLFPSAGLLWHSDDMVRWEFRSIEPFDLGYAPTVVEWHDPAGERWLLLTACGSGMWRARHPFGPWEDIGPIRDENDEPSTWADPALFVDDDGALYCYSGLGSDGIYVVPLRADNPAYCASARQSCFAFDPAHLWERAGEFNENIEKSFVEGAWMTKHEGRYYLQYSANGTEWKNYAVGCYIGETPLGPWRYQTRNPILIAPRGNFVNGAAHHSIVEGPDGTLWCFYTTLVRIEHAFERRIGMDPAGFDGDGDLFVAGPTETPQLAPGSIPHPAEGNGTGWLPVSVNRFSCASSYAPGREPSFAFDHEIRTWWEAETTDELPWIEVNLDRDWDLTASRICFADRGLDYASGIVPGPYRYRIEGSLDGVSWTLLCDQSTNETDRHIVYDTWTAQPAQMVRLTIIEAPKGMRVGVWEWTLFAQT